MNKYILTYFFVLCSFFLFSQEKLTNNFGFQNGIYLSYEEFKNNSPSLSWQDVSSELIILESIHRAKMDALISLADSSEIDIENIWGFSANGIPYKKVSKENKSEFFIFSGLVIRGRICYYSYDINEEKPVEVSAYNPVTGKPFRTQTIMRERKVSYQYLLDFETGDEEIFSVSNVGKWILSDEKLYETFKVTDPNERKKKLLKFIQIFNDRNEVYIPTKI